MLRVCMTMQVATGDAFLRNAGLAVPISGHDTTAVCSQVRSFDIEARVRAGTARFVEALDEATFGAIVAPVVNAIYPQS